MVAYFRTLSYNLRQVRHNFPLWLIFPVPTSAIYELRMGLGMRLWVLRR